MAASIRRYRLRHADSISAQYLIGAVIAHAHAQHTHPLAQEEEFVGGGGQKDKLGGDLFGERGGSREGETERTMAQMCPV
ncbi:hypothetical protein BDZ91DRAFT_729288 [Kalaharituber pfeilii]|nr:hypothetical protein BDZ91DRAFT_729288 [Kalaharituber pfeilii]